ncbi:MAG: FtsX-like permease family protein [Ignisphaera sp.]
MNMFTIILRNITKRKLRTMLTILGVAVGVGLMFSLLSISASGTQRSLELIRRISGADIVVYNGTRGFPVGMIPRAQQSSSFQLSVQQYIDIKTLEQISSIPGILTLSPVLLHRASIISSSGNMVNVGVYGVDPSSYPSISLIEIEEGRFLSRLSVYEVVVSRAIADELNVSIGDNVILELGNKSATFTIVGIYRVLNRFAENSIYIPIDIVQNIIGLNDKISQILIKCVDPSQAQEIAQQIINLVPGVSVFVPTATIQNVSQAINTVTYFFTTIGLVAITAGVFGVMNTMTMAVAERTREIGILKAIGASNSFILKLFLLESTILGFIGGGVGIFVGLMLSYIIAPMLAQVGIQRFFSAPGRGLSQPSLQQTQFSLSITPLTIALSLFLGIVVGIIAGIYPAYRAYRLKPVEALKHV